MQAHITSGVFMDVAVLKVSHSVGIDKDATALQAARARSSSIGAMERYTWVRAVSSIWCKTHPALPRHTAITVSIPVGRWMKVQGKFKDASTQKKPD